MNVWLVTIGEPLPIDEGSPRLMRHGMLAEILVARGHDVTWWTSSFDHFQKLHRAQRSAPVTTALGIEIKLLRATGYRKNRSPMRFLDHYLLGRILAREARKLPPPHIIVASFPPVELCYEAVRYGRETGTPVLIDVRDPWPDIFLDMVPRSMRWAARAGLSPLFSATNKTFKNCTAIIGITPEIVAWAADKVGRQQGPLDRSFPMAYRDQNVSRDARREAGKFWDQMGIKRNDGVFNVCYFGAMGPHLDFPGVFEASQRLNERNSPVRFILCGPRGALDPRLNAFTDNPNIVLPGWVDGAKIQELMRRSQAGLAHFHPSWNYSIVVPNKIFEYMAGGLPVLYCIGGAIDSLLQQAECGVRYKDGDPESLAHALESLKDDPERCARLGTNARRTFEERFTAENVYAAMAEFLEDIAREGK